MTSLEWQSGAVDKQEHHPMPAHPHAPATRTADPWFPAAMGLLGLVVGYLIGS